MAASRDSASFFALAINADASKRMEKLKDLASGLGQLVKDVQEEIEQQLSILTVSELGSIKAGQEFVEKLGWICIADNIIRQDNILTAFDPKVWHAWEEVKENGEVTEIFNYIISSKGRYLAFKLKHIETKMTLMYFSVHLPHKSNRDQAYKALHKAMVSYYQNQDVDCVMIGGDRNMEPSEILEKFVKTPAEGKENLEFKLALSSDVPGGTSPGGRTIDNFALLQRKQGNQKVSFGRTQIMREKQAEYTSHAQILAEARLNRSKANSEAESEGSTSERAKKAPIH